jgi:hypothetical protein
LPIAIENINRWAKRSCVAGGQRDGKKNENSREFRCSISRETLG